MIGGPWTGGAAGKGASTGIFPLAEMPPTPKERRVASTMVGISLRILSACSLSNSARAKPTAELIISRIADPIAGSTGRAGAFKPVSELKLGGAMESCDRKELLNIRDTSSMTGSMGGANDDGGGPLPVVVAGMVTPDIGIFNTGG